MTLTNEDIDELKDYLDEIKERRYYDFEFERLEELKKKLELLKNKEDNIIDVKKKFSYLDRYKPVEVDFNE